MQSLFLTAVFLSLMVMGFSAAFAAALGFVWVDIVKPQQLASSILTNQPLSIIAAATMLILFMIKDRKSPPKFGSIQALILMFAIWVTLTSFMSTVPEVAWIKWDWAFKVLVFALLFPYIFRSRVQLDAFILVFIFSAATIFFSAGIKTLLGSGGYGVLAVMGSGNSGLSESSTLAAVCAALIPLIVYSMQHTLLLPKAFWTKALFTLVIITAVATVIGTSARTGIIALGIAGLFLLAKSNNKKWWIAGAIVGALILANIDLSATPWGARMSTIETYNQDSSALGRLKVWGWTLEFVGDHPLGGGFNAFVHNRISEVLGDGTVIYYPDGVLQGKAYHSIYFEVLGEQGFPGLIIYLSMFILALLKLRNMKKQWRGYQDLNWLVALAEALTASIIIFMVAGAFVGIAYQPFIFYMVSLSVALDQYSLRVDQQRRRQQHLLQGKLTGRAIA